MPGKNLCRNEKTFQLKVSHETQAGGSLSTEETRRCEEGALGKAQREEELTEKEFMIVQWVTSSGGCHACSPRIVVSPGMVNEPRRERGDR